MVYIPTNITGGGHHLTKATTSCGRLRWAWCAPRRSPRCRGGRCWDPWMITGGTPMTWETTISRGQDGMIFNPLIRIG